MTMYIVPIISLHAIHNQINQKAIHFNFIQNLRTIALRDLELNSERFVIPNARSNSLTPLSIFRQCPTFMVEPRVRSKHLTSFLLLGALSYISHHIYILQVPDEFYFERTSGHGDSRSNQGGSTLPILPRILCHIHQPKIGEVTGSSLFSIRHSLSSSCCPVFVWRTHDANDG